MTSHRKALDLGKLARPNRIPIDEQKCRECIVLEDEYHFVIECKLYDDFRITYIPTYFWRRPSVQKFVELINSSNINYLGKLGTFTNYAFKHRNELLFN